VWAALAALAGTAGRAASVVLRARRCRHTTIWLIVPSRRARQPPLAPKWRIISCNNARSNGKGRASSDCVPGPCQVAIDIYTLLLTL
jgi:hypothetical protein